jgi:hypothetical protein
MDVYSGIFLKGLRKITKASVKTIDVLGELRTWYIYNETSKLYRLASLLHVKA